MFGFDMPEVLLHAISTFSSEKSMVSNQESIIRCSSSVARLENPSAWNTLP